MRCHKHTGGSVNRLLGVVVMSNQQASVSQRCKRREKKNAIEEYIAMSKAHAVLSTVVFGWWQLNYVEQLLPFRSDIEKTSTSPVSSPLFNRDTKRKREKESNTHTHIEEKAHRYCLLLLAMMPHRLTYILHRRHCPR
jgi:hypothetical protein